MSVLVTPAIYPRVFEILTTLTFGALRKSHSVSPTFEDITKKKNKKTKTMKPRRPRVLSNVSWSVTTEVRKGRCVKKKSGSDVHDGSARKRRHR